MTKLVGRSIFFVFFFLIARRFVFAFSILGARFGWLEDEATSLQNSVNLFPKLKKKSVDFRSSSLVWKRSVKENQTRGIPHVREVSNPRAMLRATSRSCKAGTSPPVCCTLLLASLTVVLVAVASSSAPPAAANRFGSSLPQVFTNSFLVKLRGVHDRKQADQIARRNGFENWGSVNNKIIIKKNPSI